MFKVSFWNCVAVLGSDKKQHVKKSNDADSNLLTLHILENGSFRGISFAKLNQQKNTSHNANNSSIGSTCASADLSLDTHDGKILNILEELKCSADQRFVEECTEQ